MILKHNKQRMSLREGKVFIDGVEVMDLVECTINFTPDVASGRQVGSSTPDARWIGETVTGSINRYRNTPWLKEVIKRYLRTRRTPEFTIQGLNDDPNSDYGNAHGSDLTTCLGCVFTGDLPLTRLNADGEFITDAINFTAKSIV